MHLSSLETRNQASGVGWVGKQFLSFEAYFCFLPPNVSHKLQRVQKHLLRFSFSGSYNKYYLIHRTENNNCNHLWNAHRVKTFCMAIRTVPLKVFLVVNILRYWRFFGNLPDKGRIDLLQGLESWSFWGEFAGRRKEFVVFFP